MDPHTLIQHLTSLYQGTGAPPFYTGIQEVFSLAHHLKIEPSMQTICGPDSGLQTHWPHFLSSAIPATFPSAHIASSSTVMLSNPRQLATRLEPIYELKSNSSPPAKHSKHSHKKEIMAPPTDH